MTYQELLNRARVPMNDAAKVRYTDAEGLEYAKEAVRLLRRQRPDAFLGSLSDDPAAAAVLGTTLPVSFEHWQALADYVSARWQDKDDELTGEKAAQWMQMAAGGMR